MQEKEAHNKTQTSLQLKTERLVIAEKQNKQWDKSVNPESKVQAGKPLPKHQKKPSYEQPTYTVTEAELAKHGKEQIIENLRKNN